MRNRLQSSGRRTFIFAPALRGALRRGCRRRSPPTELTKSRSLRGADQAGDDFAETEQSHVGIDHGDRSAGVCLRSEDKLVELARQAARGPRVGVESPEVLANAYDLFVDVWSRKRERAGRRLAGRVGRRSRLPVIGRVDESLLARGSSMDAYVYRDDWGDGLRARITVGTGNA